MNTPPYISVIIPALNEEEHIGHCLDSVFGQDLQSGKMEVFVVDGGSKDRTEAIVKQYQEVHSTLFFMKNRKTNQASGFNTGLLRARGEIIIRMDAHAYYQPDYVKRIVENFGEQEYGNVGGRWIIIPGANTIMAEAIAQMNASRFVIGGAAFRVGKSRKLVDSVPFGAFPRRVLEKVGEMNEALYRGEDNEFNARIRAAGYKVLFDPDIVSHYVSRATLVSFLQQMYSNGYSIGVLLRQKTASVGLRHLVPSLFLLFVLSGSLCSVIIPPAMPWFISVMGLYFLLDLGFAIGSGLKNKLGLIPAIFCATFLVHLVYGAGTLRGLGAGSYHKALKKELIQK